MSRVRPHIFTVLAAGLLALTSTSARATPEAITADVNGVTLAGTLESPATPPHATALILPGSGPTDRDGNSPLGISSNSYRLLAEALAAHGVATARIDKRGIGDSGGDGNAVSLALYRADTAAWIATLRARTGASCVWLFGHSEGAIIALASADLPDVCGLVLLTPPGRPLGAVMMDQIAANPALAASAPAVRAAIEAMISGQPPDLSSLHPALAPMFNGPAQDYLTELFRTDPAELLAATDLPVLIIHGDADIQVSPAEAAPLTEANPDAQMRLLSGLTHVLKTATPQALASTPEAYATESLATYSDPDMPLHSGLIPTILDHIGQPE